MKQQQHSNNGLSTPSLPSTTHNEQQHDHSPLRNPHNIPLAPPAPPPPQIPSIEIGKKTYLQPELRAGLQESDDLLSKMPAELRTRPNFNKARQQQQQPAPNPPPPSASPYNNHSSTTTATHYQQPTIPPPRSILINSQENLPRQSNPSDNAMPAYPIANDIYNYYGQHSNNIPSQQRQEEGSTNASLRPINDEEKEDDESSNQTQRHSTWSYASTGKSSGTYSLYSTFGTDSRPTSESVLDLDTTSDKEENKEQPSPVAPPPEQQVDLAQIVCNNVRGKSPARIITNDIDDEASSSDSDEDVFVDATGMSQEDLEREKLNGKRISKRLSKRLSGGHFGSAGGLMLSINAPPPPPVPSLPPKLPNDDNESITSNSQPTSHDHKVIEKNTPSSTPSPSIESSVAPETPPQSSSLSDLSLSKTANAMGISADAASEKVELGTSLSPPPPRRPMSQRRKRSFHGQQAVIDTEPTQANDTALPEIRLEQQQPQLKDGEARFASQKIWNGDESFVTKERAAEWLGQGYVCRERRRCCIY